MATPKHASIAFLAFVFNDLAAAQCENRECRPVISAACLSQHSPPMPRQQRCWSRARAQNECRQTHASGHCRQQILVRAPGAARWSILWMVARAPRRSRARASSLYVCNASCSSHGCPSEGHHFLHHFWFKKQLTAAWQRCWTSRQRACVPAAAVKTARSQARLARRRGVLATTASWCARCFHPAAVIRRGRARCSPT